MAARTPHVTEQVCVLGLWHLGCVTAACLADPGASVVGLDFDEPRVQALQHGTAPIAEPGLDELIRAGLASGRLDFTCDPARALSEARAKARAES